MVLVGLDVARPDPDQRARVDRQLGVRWREQYELARPRQEAVRELEPRVLLADDADPPARIRLGRPDVGVMVAERLARAGRRVRLGDPDRHDQDLGPIRAVRRLDHVASAVRRLLDARPGPAALVADGDPGALGEGREVRLHLRSRREVRRPIHQLGLDRPGLRGLAEQAVPVVALVGAGPLRRPARAAWSTTASRWKNGQRRNMPPGDGSDEMTACWTPSRLSEYETWSAPGPEPITTTGYAPGGNGRSTPGRSVNSAIGSRRAGGGPGPGASGT